LESAYSSSAEESKTDGQTARADSPVRRSSFAGVLARVGTGTLIGAVYYLTVHPGVSSGDSAEIQYASATLGVCHSPGYQVEVHFGKLFSLLPVGNVAWRVNLMMLVFGLIGCLSLYDALERITGRILPAVVGATTLAFSSIYWSHAIVAEAYVFYGAFLLIGLWAAVRFVFSNKAAWLYVMAVALGICAWDRSSELFVLPAFLLLWLGFRKRVRLGLPRVAAAVALFLVPLVFTATSYMIRQEASRLPMRDDALRDQILGRPRGDPRFASLGEAPRALCYCLALGWADRGLPPARAWADLKRYAWLLSGLGAVSEYMPLADRQEMIERGRGTSIGFVGILLVLWGSFLWRRNRGWVVLGWGLFLGNLAFCLWNSRWDSLTFTVPGLAGLALLAGLGASWPQETGPPSRRRVVGKLACLIAPVFLLATNYSLLNRATGDEYARLALSDRMAATPLPESCAILCRYWTATRLRYVFHVQAGRSDIHVFNIGEQEELLAVFEYCRQQGWEVFIPRHCFRGTPEAAIAASRTPAAMLDFGLVQATQASGVIRWEGGLWAY